VRRSDAAFAAVAAALLGFAAWLAAARVAQEPLMLHRLTVSPFALASSTARGALRGGETLAALAERLGVPRPQVPEWLAAAGARLSLRSLPVGLAAEVETVFPGEVRALRLTPDWRSTVVLTRDGGAVRASTEARPVERALVVVGGTVRSSLFDAVAAAGEQEDLAVSLADLFAWDVDFHREVREGDTFAVLVEKVSSGGRTVAYGPLLAASYTNRGRRVAAVGYATGGAKASYYDERGRPLRKRFLRAPLKFSRLTSRFSLSRLHPILGVRLPHWGVDYAAPVGTPVMATADGVVAFTGWRGGGGNAVELRHADGYVTGYLHLSRIAAGIAPGVRVRQGEVIGFVGATGLATGPHLDYRVTQNGRHLNPMGLGHEPGAPLPAAELERFSQWAGRLLPLLAAPGPLAPPSLAALQGAAPVPLHG